MKSVASTCLLLALFSPAMIVQLFVQPVTCRHLSHHKDTTSHDFIRDSYLQKDHGHKKSPHTKHHIPEKHQKNTDPHPYEVIDHQPLGYWPVCSWCHSINFDANRVPKVLPLASCCRTQPRLNITGDTRLVNARCETVYYNLLVRQRSKDPTSDPNSWEDKWLKVPAGCTPAHPDTLSNQTTKKISSEISSQPSSGARRANIRH